MPKPPRRKKVPPSKRKPRVRWFRQTVDIAGIWVLKALASLGLDRFSDWL